MNNVNSKRSRYPQAKHWPLELVCPCNEVEGTTQGEISEREIKYHESARAFLAARLSFRREPEVIFDLSNRDSAQSGVQRAMRGPQPFALNKLFFDKFVKRMTYKNPKNY